MDLRMITPALSSPAYTIEVDKITATDKGQSKYVKEFADTGEIPSRMRACVNCIGSCGAKDFLLEKFPEGKTTHNIILGTGCYGVVNGQNAKKISVAGNVSRLQPDKNINTHNHQHAGYVYKDMILNMKVKKIYVCLRKHEEGKQQIEVSLAKLHENIVELDGKKYIVPKFKEAKELINQFVVDKLSDGYNIFYLTNSKGNELVSRQDLRKKVKGAKIDAGDAGSWEEYQKRCADIAEQYTDLIEKSVDDFLESTESAQDKKFSYLFDKMGLADHVADFQDINEAISYLFPNQVRSELYRGLVSSHIGEME